MTAPVNVVHLQIPATFQDARTVGEAVEAMLCQAGLDNATARQLIQLAIHEICTNIVEHAFAGQSDGAIEVTLTVEQRPRRQLVADLRDRGQPFDSASVMPLDLSQAQEGGYGLFLAQELMDQVQYQRLAGQNVWRLTKAF